MEIKNLKDTSARVILDCLLEAFANYFVKMPTALSYWQQRFKKGRVNFDYSYGVFSEGQLVAFIINGIDEHEGKRTAFNTGTGVIPRFRGQALVDKIYDYALPQLKAFGIQKCGLEVIQQNDRAIRVYQRIGFEKTSALHSFKIEDKLDAQTLSLRVENFEDLAFKYTLPSVFYAWDFQDAAVALSKDDCESYSVWEDNQWIGHFTINRAHTDMIQFAVKDNRWTDLLASAQQLSTTLRIINVDDRNPQRLAYLQQATAFKNIINQYQMEMLI